MGDDDVNAFQGEEAFQTYLRNVAHHRNIVTYRMTSEEAWHRLGHARFDMVWIDADHSYEHVSQDILRWRSLLTRDGLLCGHDGEYDGVALAVKELVPNAKFFATPQPPPFEPSLIWYADGQ